MSTFYRFLLWLLIATLPLQGGAVAMLPCVQLSLPATTPGAHAAAGGHSAHCAPETAQQKKVSDHARCSHCSACASVLGVALPAVQAPMPLLGVLPERPELAMSGHIPAGLERPPQAA